jgi:hypothetical protein
MEESKPEAVPDVIKGRLDAVKAKRNKLAEQRAQRELEDAAKAELRAQENALRDEEIVEQYGVPLGTRGIDWELVSSVQGAAIIRRPAAIVYRQFIDQERFTSAAIDNLVRRCLAYPSAKEYDEICDRLPGFTVQCGNAATALGRGKQEEREGK